MSKNDRDFNFSDASLLSYGEVLAATMPNDVTNFNVFDNTINDQYPVKITDAIAEVKNIRTDQVVIDEMTEHTQAVNNALAACNSYYKTVSFFVRKAFKGNTAVQNQFGLNDIAKVRMNVPKMIIFMNDIAGVVAKHQSQLVEVGCNEGLLSTGQKLGEDLKNCNVNQQRFIKERGLITQERVEKLNALYALIRPVSEIANIIFADNPAKLAVYQMPKPKSSTNSHDDLVVS